LAWLEIDSAFLLIKGFTVSQLLNKDRSYQVAIEREVIAIQVSTACGSGRVFSTLRTRPLPQAVLTSLSTAIRYQYRLLKPGGSYSA
jgi:hypothetical protein